MTMTRTQTIDEIKTVMAYLTESCGGYPVCLDEAIRMLTDDGQKLEKIEEYTREPFSHPDDYDQGNWHKAQALANILTIFDYGLQ